MVVLRYLPNGVLDRSFSGDGVAVVPTANDGRGVAVTIDGRGRIVACGGAGLRFLVARLTPAGAMDRDYGIGGRVVFGFEHQSVCEDVALTPSGRVVAGGITTTHRGAGKDLSIAVARLAPNGVLDTSFNGTGEVTTNSGSGDSLSSLVVQQDGRILEAGASDFTNFLGKHLELVRYTPNGALDTTFGGGGFVNMDFGPGTELFLDVVLAGGKATTCGGVQTSTSGQGHVAGVVARFLLS
jgi:uncharacterized delta-60 repeat protein